MSKPASRRFPAILLDVENDDDVNELLQMLGSSQPQVSSRSRTVAELEAWILKSDPLHLPDYLVAPMLDTECNAYILLSGYSIEPRIVVSAALSEMENLLGVRSSGAAAGSGWFGSKTIGVRVDAIKERIKRVRSRECTYGVIEVNDEAHAVFANGHKLRLTPTEFRLLRKFVCGPERVHSRETLLNTISQDQYEVADRSIDAHIKNLRSKIRKAAGSDVKISTVYGVGYKLEKLQTSSAKLHART